MLALTKLVIFSLLMVYCNCLPGGIGMPGGLKKVDLSDVQMYNKIKDHANFAIEKITSDRKAQLKSKSKLQLLRIIEAKSQVVAGSNYFIKLRIKDADCTRSCAVEECDIKVYERQWENFKEVTKYDCELKKPRNLALLGAYSDISTEKETVKNALDFALKELNKDFETYHKLNKIVSAKQQLVAGYNYQIEFSILPTNCKNNNIDVQNLDTCTPISDNSVKCSVTIWERPWLFVPYKITRNSCN